MRAQVAVLAAALCFATTGTAQAVAHAAAGPFAVGMARIALGGAVLWAASLAVARKGPPPARTRGAALPLALAAAGVLAYQPLFFLGTREGGVAVGTVIALGSAPVFTGLADAVSLRRRPPLRWAAATAVALVGVWLVSGLADHGVSVRPQAALASLGAGASYALYTVAIKAVIDRGRPPAQAMGAVFGLAAACALPLLAVAGVGWLASPRGWALALWLGLVATALAYALFGWGLARLRPASVATLTLAEPLGATLLGLGVLHEPLSLAARAGLAAIAAGLAVLILPTRRAARPDGPDPGEPGPPTRPK
ncbi:MAG: DMT family transporter [Bifidobacteriaceae bacterium]|nr:DMT family transporter [Bifidobacteriaceae bacterium]